MPSKRTALTPWTILNSRTLISSPWLSLYQQKIQTAPNRIIPDFYMIQEKKWAMTVPLVRRSLFAPNEEMVSAPLQQIRMVMIRQYRHGASKLSWEFPAGQVDESESERDAAVRELKEETGALNVAVLHDLGEIFSEPARNTNMGRGYLVVCDWEEEEHSDDPDSPRKHEQILEEHENIEVRAFALQEILGMIERGEVFHGAHVAFMMKAYMYMLEKGVDGLRAEE